MTETNRIIQIPGEEVHWCPFCLWAVTNERFGCDPWDLEELIQRHMNEHVEEMVNAHD